MKNLLTILILIIVLLGAFNSDLFAQFFKEKVDYYVGQRPNTVASADFDDDGDIDLAASPNTPNYGLVTILKNNGDGTFYKSDSLLVGNGPNLTMVDFDNDTTIDLVVSDWDPPYQMYLISNDGSGNFAITDSFPSYGTQAHLLCAADFDDDDDFDLAVPNSASSNIGLFFNNGDGSFALPPPLLTVGSSPICALPGDLDTNGYVDLVVSLAGENSIRVLLNDSTGNFPVGSNYQTGIEPFAHSLADYNRDGCLDVAVPNYSSNTLSVMFGNCDGTFGSKVDHPGCQPILAASADLDNDGDIDIAVSNNGCNTVSVYRNNGDGIFPSDSSYTLVTGNGPVGITANDFNGDGWIDLAVCNFDNLDNFIIPGYTVSVFINQQRAIIFPLDTKTDKNYLETSDDSIKITTYFDNYYENEFTANAIYISSDNLYTDSIALYDDGLHGDSLANDGLYGGFVPSFSEEEFFNLEISTIDNQTGRYYITEDLARFTTAGPIKIDSVLMTYNSLFKIYKATPFVRNVGQFSTLENISLTMSSDDSLITSISSGSINITSIAPGEVVFPSGSFTVRVDSNFNVPFKFIFDIKSDGWLYWQDSIDIITNVEDEKLQPLAFKIEQNYPNPFNPSTKIKYSIPQLSQVQIKVYDVLGNEIETLVNEDKPTGVYELSWNAANLPSGVYFYKLQAGTYIETKKMILLK